MFPLYVYVPLGIVIWIASWCIKGECMCNCNVNCCAGGNRCCNGVESSSVLAICVDYSPGRQLVQWFLM